MISTQRRGDAEELTVEQVQSVVRDAVTKAVMEPPLTEAQYQTEMAEESEHRAELERRLNAVVEENRRARQEAGL